MPPLACLALLLASPGPHVLSLSVAPEVGCETAAVRAALERRFGPGKVVEGPATGDQPSLHLVRAADGTVELELAEGRAQPTTRRSFEAKGSCADVAETVALLTTAWLQQLPWKGEGILPEAVEAQAQQKVVAPAPPTAVPTPPADIKPEIPVPAVAPKVPSERTPIGPSEVEGRPTIKTSVTPEVVHSGPPAAPKVAQSPPRVSLQLGFGGSLDANAAAPGYFGSALVDVAVDRRRRFGVGLDFDYLDNLDFNDAATAPGSLRLERQALRVFGRYAFNPDRGLRLLVGVGGDRYAATPSGFTTNTPKSVVDPELWASACWLQPLWKRLYFFGQAGFSVELQQEQFYLDPNDVLVTLSPVWFSLTAGLGAQLF